MIDPDSDLIRESQSGNKAAFGRLTERYYEMVYALAFGVLHEKEAARDVTQDVFLKVFRQIKNFKGDSKFKTWLYRISVNAAIDEARKKRPMQSLDATDASDEEDTPPVIIHEHRPGPDEQASQSELGGLVRKALDELSPEHRAVLVLREWQDLSYDEIAETLGVQVGTVMSRLFYARKKIAEILGLQLKDQNKER